MMNRVLIGLAALVAVAAIVWQMLPASTPIAVAPTAIPSPTAIPIQQVTVVSNGSTCGLLKNPKFQAIVADPAQMESVTGHQVSLRISAICQGTIEMVDQSKGDEPTELWLAHDLALTRYQKKLNDQTRDYDQDSGRRYKGYEYNLFSTQLVLIVQKPVAQALMKTKEPVVQSSNGLLVASTPRLIETLRTRQSWASIGIPKDGPINLIVAHPAKDESGMIWTGLVARQLLGDKAYSDENIDKAWPDVTTVIDQRQDLAASSKVVLDRLLQEDAPGGLVFENQYAEYFLRSPEPVRAKMKEKFEIIQLAPTGVASFPFLARTEPGLDLVAALLNHPGIRQLAFNEHALRSPETVLTDTTVLKLVGLPANFQDPVSLPNRSTMLKIVDRWRLIN